MCFLTRSSTLSLTLVCFLIRSSTLSFYELRPRCYQSLHNGDYEQLWSGLSAHHETFFLFFYVFFILIFVCVFVIFFLYNLFFCCFYKFFFFYKFFCFYFFLFFCLFVFFVCFLFVSFLIFFSFFNLFLQSFFFHKLFSQNVRYQWGLFKRKISSKSLEPFLRYGQKTSKMHQKWGFSPFATPQDFFSKIGLCHFCTLMVH